MGNVFEWLEADPNKPDPFEAGPYIVRGGSFFNQGHLYNTERNNGPSIGDGDSDGADFRIWQQQFGGSPGVLSSGDFNDDMVVDGGDLAAWEVAFGVTDAADGDADGHIHNEAGRTVGIRLGAVAPAAIVAVPEPSTWCLISCACLLAGLRRRGCRA